MNLNIVSKYRNEIYGFAILWVVVFHGTAINSIDYSFGNPVLMPLQSFLSVERRRRYIPVYVGNMPVLFVC